MSTQGTILHRQRIALPVWPVVALLVVAVVTAIGVRALDDLRQAEPVISIQETEGHWESTVGHPMSPRQGALGPVFDVSVIEGSAAAIRELPARPFHAPGRAHEVVLNAPAATTMPVQRLYPDGFGEVEESTPIFDGRRRKW
jgi:hypothetical protein